MSTARFLIVDDDEAFASTLARSLARRGYQVTIASDVAAAMAHAAAIQFRAITIDLHLREGSGLKLVEPLRQLQPVARMLVLTGFASIATAVAAVKLGADDYLAKPANTDSILETLGLLQTSPGVLAVLTSGAESDASAEELPEFPDLPLSVARLEWEHIQRVLAQCDGNISEAARRLNMHRRTLQRKLSKHPVRR